MFNLGRRERREPCAVSKVKVKPLEASDGHVVGGIALVLLKFRGTFAPYGAKPGSDSTCKVWTRRLLER